MRRFLRRIRRSLNAALDRDVLIKASVIYPSESHGSSYGGWTILANSLTADSSVISAGLGHDITFDISIIGKYGCRVVGYDPDPKAYAYHKAEDLPAGFEWRRYGLSDRSAVMKLYKPPRDDWVSGTVVEGAIRHSGEYDLVAIKDIVEVLGGFPGQIDILKMDIEGAEYGVIDRLIASGEIRRIKQLLVEFHHGKRYRGSDTKRCVDSIRRSGFELFFVSEIGCEFSFCRTDQCRPLQAQ